MSAAIVHGTAGRVLAMTAALACVAGCASLPTGGQVASGRPAEWAEPIDDPYVRIIPVHPRPGWPPDQIVTGFLTASASFDDQHRIAAEYLAPGTTWRPDPLPSVIMYDDTNLRIDQTKVVDGKVVVEARGTRLGSIRQDGQYEAADSRTLQETFQLAKNAAGEWRISDLPDSLTNGVLLSRRDVDRAFRSRDLYFFAPDKMVLVPNTIFLPLVDRRDLPGQLVRAVLNGPTTWLLPAVRTTFPEGTRLLGTGVDVTDGIATVNLSKEALRGDRAGMSAQLLWTLRQVPEVSRLRLEIEGEAAPPPGVGDVQTIRDWAGNDPDATLGDTAQPAYLRSANGHLELLLSNDRTQRSGTLEDGGLRSPAISLDGRSVAGLNDTRDTVLMGELLGSGAPRAVLRAQQPKARFTVPSWDRSGNLWVVESTPVRSWLWVKQPGRQPIRIERWGLGGYEVRALRVARDGVRVAAIVQEGRHGRIEIGRIVSGTPQGITAEEFLPISAELSDATDLAWRSAGELAVLGRPKTGTAQQLPYAVPISGGSIRPIGNAAPPQAHTITAAPDSPVLIAATVPVEGNSGRTEERVCRLKDAQDFYSEWQCPAVGTDPAYPG